jgi:hypothetical protein
VKNNRSVESLLFPSDSKPYGLTISQWTIKWWRWLLSIPKDKNPALDISGTNLSEGQNDPNVWFLAGTLGGAVDRTCKIPLGKAILMPVINYRCSFADEPTINTEEELTLKCKKEIDDIKNLSFQIDDMFVTDLSSYRICSPLFDVHLGENNIENKILCDNRFDTKMVSDGYWIFLKPLNIGSHKLISSGSCRSGKIMIATRYDLFVQ